MTGIAEERTAAVPVWVLGAGGMLAGELVRLLAGVPGLALAGAATREGGTPLGALHPHLGDDRATLDAAGLAGGIRDALADPDARGALVLALPHGESARAWGELRRALGGVAERLLVVDLSADHRLRDPEAHARWYGGRHPDPEELGRFAYGLPELFRERIRGATRAAAPGCFATALQLACVPAARAGLLDAGRPWVLDAVTGSSGSGVKPTAATHHPRRHGNLWAYAVGGHRHEAELLQALDVAPPLCFVPHSGPFARGIHLSAYLPLAREVEAGEARAVYAAAYAGEPFVEVLADGVPDLGRVVGSNKAALSVHERGPLLVVLLALDNLIKGGAGQALQCLLLMLGRPEGRGLPRLGLGFA